VIDKSRWRLSTAGGIKVKLLKRYGSVSRESASATEEYLIAAEDLTDFINEFLPKPVAALGGVQYLSRVNFTGVPSLIVDDIRFESFTDTKPIDPFSHDPSAPDGTYEVYLKAIVSYKPRSKTKNSQDSDPNDPRTFLEISSDISGEYVCDNLVGRYYWYDNTYNASLDKWVTTEAATEIDSPDTTQTIVSPVKEWSVTWPQIPYEYFYNTLAPKLDATIGCINSKSVDIFHGTKLPRTLLLEGYSTREEFTYDTEDVRYPLLSLTMKIKEKGFWSTNTDGAVFVTWNHCYVKGKGWRAVCTGNPLVSERGKLLVEEVDFNNIWS